MIESVRAKKVPPGGIWGHLESTGTFCDTFFVHIVRYRARC